ncbi:unnamed protein product [Paramecium pentaurelia]|uniref:Kinesin-like protein n=1 Tax=Paramecium pentaurelia TaxID=43138 RepID=A0A8S1WJC3_9CILI|nr:unnamed protein product [Paramecium pentaurelia]
MPAECVKVIVRVRPFNQKERDNGSKPCVNANESTNSVELFRNQDNDQKQFTYDYVFGPDTPQLQIYQQTAFNLVESVAEGYNGTIFAYGQTGCGKTFTMIGDPQNDNMKGIIPRTFEQIINIINNNSDSNKKFLLRCSYIEIYNEEIHDLLSKDVKQRYELKEGQQGIFVKDLNIPIVKTLQEMDKYMVLGAQNRSVGATAMNKESSRSHCIFTVYIECSMNDEKGNERITAGKLNLVDLAGSERQSKTQATGDRLKEATKINLSLSALGNVISALVDGKTQHIPYRDSKLTRLLQDSLGGNTKTIMITAISPSDFNYEETLSSLRYASRAKMIKNQPKVNEDPKDALLKEQAEEIKKLRELLMKQNQDNGDRQNVDNNGKLNNINNNNHHEQINQFKEINNQLLQEKQRYENEMKQKSEQAEQERLARQRLEELLKEKEQMMIKGGKGTDDDKNKYKKMQQAIEQQKKEHEQLIIQQEQKEKEMLEIENKYNNVQDEVEKLRKQVKYLKNKYEQQQKEQDEMKQDFEYDKEEFLDTIRSQSKEIKLVTGILRMILLQEDIEKITNCCEWNDDLEEYKIPPFNIKAKKVNFPNLPYQKAMDLIDVEKQDRHVEIHHRPLPSSYRDVENNRNQSPGRQRKGESQPRMNGNTDNKGLSIVEKTKLNQQLLEIYEGKTNKNQKDELQQQQQLQKRVNQKIILNPIDNRGNPVPNLNNQCEAIIINNNQNNNQNTSQITPPLVKKISNLNPLDQKPPTGRLAQQQKIQQQY